MNLVEAIILGAIQGVAEFLPISSSGHLIIARELMGVQHDSLAFDVGLHIATLVAIIITLLPEIISLLKIGIEKPLKSLAIKIIIATIPVAIFGIFINEHAIRNVFTVSIALIFWGIILIIADEVAKKAKFVKNLEKINWGQSILIGLAQVLALIPGTSRSGITITAGLFSGLDRVSAAKFSFLLAIPAIAGAGLLTGIKVLESGLDVSLPALMAGMLSAFLFGIASIRFLLAFVRTKSYRVLAVYRIILGIILLLFFI
ncbi:undecaprenyl-diphosphate phosphatase [Candidatus Parcubacteria bacterium]|nr:MAG: undecaprenyl-diphosphate phosphatase [Candidatus Parcubacteria bacterium]